MRFPGHLSRPAWLAVAAAFRAAARPVTAGAIVPADPGGYDTAAQAAPVPAARYPVPGRCGQVLTVAAARGQARRGDLVVVAVDSGYWPGEVTGITRAGDVRLWRAAGKVPGLPGDGDRLNLAAARVYVVPAGLIEVRGALATAAVHAQPGAAATGMPYQTPGDLYAALRPHLRSSPVADFLRRAALQREAAIEAAARAAAAHHSGPDCTQAGAGAVFRAAATLDLEPGR